MLGFWDVPIYFCINLSQRSSQDIGPPSGLKLRETHMHWTSTGGHLESLSSGSHRPPVHRSGCHNHYDNDNWPSHSSDRSKTGPLVSFTTFTGSDHSIICTVRVHCTRCRHSDARMILALITSKSNFIMRVLYNVHAVELRIVSRVAHSRLLLNRITLLMQSLGKRIGSDRTVRSLWGLQRSAHCSTRSNGKAQQAFHSDRSFHPVQEEMASSPSGHRGYFTGSGFLTWLTVLVSLRSARHNVMSSQSGFVQTLNFRESFLWFLNLFIAHRCFGQSQSERHHPHHKLGHRCIGQLWEEVNWALVMQQTFLRARRLWFHYRPLKFKQLVSSILSHSSSMYGPQVISFEQL